MKQIFKTKSSAIGLSIIIAVIIIALILWLSFGAHQQAKAVRLPATPVKLAQAKMLDLPVVATAMGQLVTQQNITLTAQQAGLVEKILVKNGEHVKQGQLLLVLQHQDQKADIQKSKAAYQAAQLQFNRYQKLLKEGAIAADTFDQAQSAYQQAKAALQQAQQSSAETKLIAPFSGRVGIIPVAVGSNIAVGDALMPITHLVELDVQYQLPEHDYGQTKIGQVVSIKTSAYPGQTFVGKVTYIAPTVHQSTRAFDVRASVENPQEELVPGMLATVTQILNPKQSVLVIPTLSLVPSIDGMTVYRIKKDKVYSVPVTVARQYADWAVLAKGLKTGESVIASGNTSVNLGSTVKVVS